MADITLMTLNFSVPGCTDESAANYNPAATTDDGSCIALSFFDCYESALLSLDLKDCEDTKHKRAMKLIAVYTAYQQSLVENNQEKIKMYGDELSKLCNAEYCESC